MVHPIIDEADDRRVVARAAAYLADLELGSTPDVAVYARDLDPAERVELDDLIRTALWSRSLMPATMVPQRTVGGRYELVRELGAGGFGRVWRARDLSVGRDVALKAISAVASPCDRGRLSFEQERRALAQIDHVGVVRILDAGEECGVFYLVTELVAGTTLAEIVKAVPAPARGCAPAVEDLRRALAKHIAGAAPIGMGRADLLAESSYPRAVARILVEVLRTLEVVHALGVVHRDLKPANAMLTAGGWPKLLDFGLAAIRDHHAGVTSDLVGTLNYLAPEQLRTERTGRDVRTDVYQVGLILYELLCLRPAFRHDAAGTSYADIIVGRYPVPRAVAPWIPRDLEDICLRAMELAPARRYPDAAQFRADLEAWLGGLIPATSRAGHLGRIARRGRGFVRQHRAATAAAGSALLGVLAATILLWPAEPQVRVLAFDTATGHATLHVTHPQAVVLTLRAWRPDASEPAYLRAVEATVGDGAPASALPLPAGSTTVRVALPEGFFAAQDAALHWDLRALSFGPSQLEAAAGVWRTLVGQLAAEPEVAGLTVVQTATMLDAHGRGGSDDPGIGAADVMRRLRAR